MHITTAIQCEICEQDLDVEGEVSIESQRESFWGQPVSMDVSECEIIGPIKCDSCGEPINEDSVREKMFEIAIEY